MAISYNAGTGVTTVTGYTEGTPGNFTDIYNADVAGGWGVWAKNGNQFNTSSALKIGDGSTTTWFADEAKQVEFTGADVPKAGEGVNYDWKILLKANSNFRLGKVEDATDKTTSNGCQIIFNLTGHAGFGTCLNSPPSTAKLELYSTTIVSIPAYVIFIYGASGAKIQNCLFTDYASPVRVYDSDVYNLIIENGYYGVSEVSGTVDKIVITHAGDAFTAPLVTVTVSNVICKNNTSMVYFSAPTANLYLVNVDSDDWTMRYSANTTTYKAYRQYEFDLELVDATDVGIDTAKVKIWDKNNNIVTNTTTNASGILSTQTLVYGYYQKVYGSTPQMQTPHEMRIYKYGKLMLGSKSSIEKQTDWALTMLTDSYITQTTEATVAAYTGITVNHTTETITISENHTLDGIYDYCQYDIIAATKQLDQTMRTADGVNFVSEYSFVVNDGVTVTATDQKLSTVSGETYNLNTTGQFTGIIATTTTTRIPIKLTNIIDGSRYWVGKESDGSKIFEGTQSGSGDVVGYYEHTADINIDIRARKSSASVKYKPWVGEGTLSAEAFSLRIRQIQDSIIT